MAQAADTSTKVRTGVVGAYVAAGQVEVVQCVRRGVGPVRLRGKSGMAVLKTLVDRDDLEGVDLDPAGYLKPASDQLELFAEDWTSRQRDLGLRVIRSQGRFVPRADLAALKVAMHAPLADDVVRVISLHETWLRQPNLRLALDAVKACDNGLAFVFASVMDPFAAPGAVD